MRLCGFALLAGLFVGMTEGAFAVEEYGRECSRIDELAAAHQREGAVVETQAAALAPLSESELALCGEAATKRAFKEALEAGRFAVLAQTPVLNRACNRFVRTCKVGIFNYTGNEYLQATIDLSDGRAVTTKILKDVQPAIGAGETAVARSIAESAPLPDQNPNDERGAKRFLEARARLSQILLQPLEQLNITSMVRTDGGRCRTHRCVEVNYFQLGSDAGTAPAAEPPNQTVTWKPSKMVAQVVVDLTSLSLVSIEVF
jgi:hypothetical protein